MLEYVIAEFPNKLYAIGQDGTSIYTDSGASWDDTLALTELILRGYEYEYQQFGLDLHVWTVVGRETPQHHMSRLRIETSIEQDREHAYLHGQILPYAGAKIERAELVPDRNNNSDNVLRITFADGRAVELCDEARHCCESRYMTCDDDLSAFSGDHLMNLVIGYGGWEEHEECFVTIRTDGGSITLCTHNEHNGYYGGFSLAIREAEL